MSGEFTGHLSPACTGTSYGPSGSTSPGSTSTAPRSASGRRVLRPRDPARARPPRRRRNLDRLGGDQRKDAKRAIRELQMQFSEARRGVPHPGAEVPDVVLPAPAELRSAHPDASRLPGRPRRGTHPTAWSPPVINVAIRSCRARQAASGVREADPGQAAWSSSVCRSADRLEDVGAGVDLGVVVAYGGSSRRRCSTSSHGQPPLLPPAPLAVGGAGRTGDPWRVTP